jgi:hypothetical protein
MEMVLQMASSGTSSRFRLTRMIIGRFSIFSVGAEVASAAVADAFPTGASIAFTTGASIWTGAACRKGERAMGMLVRLMSDNPEGASVQWCEQ